MWVPFSDIFFPVSIHLFWAISFMQTAADTYFLMVLLVMVTLSTVSIPDSGLSVGIQTRMNPAFRRVLRDRRYHSLYLYSHMMYRSVVKTRNTGFILEPSFLFHPHSHLVKSVDSISSGSLISLPLCCCLPLSFPRLCLNIGLPLLLVCLSIFSPVNANLIAFCRCSL